MRAPARTAAIGWAGLLRQSIFGRLAGYEDVNAPFVRRLPPP